MAIQRETILELQKRLINLLIGTDEPKTEAARAGRRSMDNWDWFQGVALFGLYLYQRKTKDAAVRKYLIDWFDGWFAKGLPGKNVNSACPMLTLSFLYEETGNAKYKPYLDEWLDYAMNGLPRTVEGGMQHKTIDSENEMQLWDDTLYMTVLFIAKQGVMRAEDAPIQESIRQYLIHLKYLTDPVTGLFFHGWTFLGRHHFAEALWGRGNAWYIAGLVDYLDITPLPEGVRMVLLSALERQVEALLKYQDDDGMWHTLLNHPESSYAEASATAGIAYGMLKSVRLGYLKGENIRSAALKAANAIMGLIDEDGILQQTSAGTCVGDTLDYYRNIRVGVQPYGQSMALLMLVELENHITD